MISCYDIGVTTIHFVKYPANTPGIYLPTSRNDTPPLPTHRGKASARVARKRPRQVASANCMASMALGTLKHHTRSADRCKVDEARSVPGKRQKEAGTNRDRGENTFLFDASQNRGKDSPEMPAEVLHHELSTT